MSGKSPEDSGRAATGDRARPASAGQQDFWLVSQMMQIFSEKNAPLEALDWALPQLLAAISAEAGALFMPGRTDGILVCSVCAGPVDIAGAEVPVASSLVGKVFSDGKRRLSRDLQIAGRQGGAAHDPRIDRQTGLATRSALTVPVALGPDRFGALQANNKKGSKNAAFNRAFADRLEALAGVLGLAIANMRLARQAVHDRLLERDLEQAGRCCPLQTKAADLPG